MSENLVEDQIAEATMLCTLCQGLRLTELVALEIECDEESETCRLMNTARAYHHQPSFEALCLSSGNGCILCQLMSQVLEKDQDWSDDDKLYGSKNGESDDDLVLQLRTACSTQIYVYSVDGSDRQDDAGIFEIAVVSTFSSQRKTSSSSPANPDAFFWRALEVWPENGERIGDLTGYAHRRQITLDPLSDHAIGIFKHWFSTCHTLHTGCNTDMVHAMPTRIIDVGPYDDSVEPRLYQSQGEHGQWATLSHCWGKTATTKLTSATLEEHLEAIPLATMPQNFRDAIMVTRLLGIRYLWIDSLCIIQNSTEDWLQESAKMGDTYKDSLITIAGTNAQESTAGFLRKRTSEIRCHMQGEGYMHTSVLIRPRIEWYGFPEIVGPLTHRAWVLQERLLSPRILHFGGQQVMWQCQTRSLAEGFCDSDPVPQEQIPGAIESLLRTEFHTVTKIESIMEGNTSIDKMRDERYESILPGPDAMAKSVYRVQDSIYGQWYQVVAMYAKLQLTKQTDRLPAIAGIARHVQLRTGDTYLCGLWKSDIVRGLHWCYSPPSVMIRPATPRAPSWSWASLDLTADESLVPPSTDFHLLATYASQHIPYEHEVSLVSFESSLIDHGCLGSSAGSVTLLGLWRIAMISTSMVVPPGRFNLSYPTPLVLKGQAPSICAAARLDVDRNHIDDAEIGCLQLGKFQYIGPKYPSEAFVAALLLQRVSQANNASPRFVRIGLAVLFNDCDPVNGWDERAVEVV